MASNTSLASLTVNSHNSHMGTLSYSNSVETINAARTLTTGDSGKIFFLSSTNGAYAIGTPAVSNCSGVEYTFIIDEHTPTGVITINFTTASLHFVQHDVDESNGSNSATATGKDSMTIRATAAKGDQFQVISDGTLWYGRVLSAVDDAFDHTA